MTIILVFGTSTTYGAWDVEGGWVQRLRKYLDIEQLAGKRDYTLVYNLGIDGDTSKGILERFEDETKRRLWPDEDVVMIFAVGTNDALTDEDKGRNRIAIENFEKNLIRIIEKARRITNKIVFVGNKPIDDSKTQPVAWDKNVYYKSEHGRKYDSIIKKICEKEKVNFVDIAPKLEAMNFKKYLDDGVHPNSKGHEIIFEIIKDYLIKDKII